jgi:hypothetical protein
MPRRTLAISLALALSAGAHAGQRQLVHQGRLLDALGAPVDGPTDLIVALYRSASGGSAHFDEAFADVPVADGYFSLTLGTDPLTDALTDADVAGALWVGVSVGGVELSRQPVVAGVGRFVAPSVASLATCDAANVGAIVLHSTAAAFYGCDGTGWALLGARNDGRSADTAGTSCKQLQDDGHLSIDGSYWVAPAGSAARQVWCEADIDGGGWTKILYSSGGRALSTASISPETLGATFAGAGKLPDVEINALMTGSREMLAVYAPDPTKWVRVTWGASWVFDDLRSSGTLGGFCQDTGGGAILRWDGSTATATYRDSVNAQSSYCWNGSIAPSGQGGIDLQNDGLGHSNASTRDVAQTAFVMFVR